MHCDRPFYKIKVKGRLSADWSEWFNRLTLTHEPNGDTVLSGPVADQAELFGLLLRIRDLGLPLEFVIRIKPTTGRAPRKGGR